jgi:hypothetical protein
MITRRGFLAGSPGAFALSVASACGGVSLNIDEGDFDPRQFLPALASGNS